MPSNQGTRDRRRKMTPREMLWIGICKDRMELVNQAIDGGAKINQVVCLRHLPLALSILLEHEAIAKCLISRGADIEAPQSMPPIFLAAGTGNVRILELLLSKGADPQARLKWGTTSKVSVLHTAIRSRKPDAAAILIEALMTRQFGKPVIQSEVVRYLSSEACDEPVLEPRLLIESERKEWLCALTLDELRELYRQDLHPKFISLSLLSDLKKPTHSPRKKWAKS